MVKRLRICISFKFIGIEKFSGRVLFSLLNRNDYYPIFASKYNPFFSFAKFELLPYFHHESMVMVRF